MSKKDKIKIAELEAKCYIYELALSATGMKPLKVPQKKMSEIGFVLRKKK